MLYRRGLDGDEFLRGIRGRLEVADREAALRACEAVRGTPLGEVLLAGLEAAPAGPEAVDAAVDEAMLDWRPDVQEDERALAVLGRVCGLSGLLVAAVVIGSAFRHAGDAPGALRTAIGTGFGNALVAISIGAAAMILAILAKGIVRRASMKVRADLERAANLLAKGSAPAEAGPEDS